MDSIKAELSTFIDDPMDPMNNYNMADKYYSEKQYAAAFSHFMRASETAVDIRFVSRCLLRASKAMALQGGRDSKEFDLINHALSVGYKYPEVHFIKSMYHSWRGQWTQCYATCCLALELIDTYEVDEPFMEYSGKESILDQKALAEYHRARYNESRTTYNTILEMDIPEVLRTKIQNKMKEFPEPYAEPITNEYNHSQIFQDVFVETVMNKKENGTYLEIGAGHYSFGNNTLMLEEKYEWKGVSLEWNKDLVYKFNMNRKNQCLCADATKIDYSEILKDLPSTIDYLQLDCDPPSVTFEILKLIPFDTHQFNVITYEHDYYNDPTKSFRQKSRDYLTSKGYIMVVGDVTADREEQMNFEDWWVHPSVAPRCPRIHTSGPICGERYFHTEPKIKIIDCFTFYNELDLLNYRLNILDDYVDYFILVEATHTHTGHEKKLYYDENKELFEKFKDKIIHVIVDDFPCKYPTTTRQVALENEILQRNCIQRGLDKLLLNDIDVITLSDLDEIPNPELLRQVKTNQREITSSCLKMDMYYYNLNCKSVGWNAAKIISYKEFKSIQSCQYLRETVTDNIIENGGWHLAYFGDTEFIKTKLQSFAHCEFNTDYIKDNLENQVKLHKDLFNRDKHDLTYIDVKDNVNLPPLYETYLHKFYSATCIKDHFEFYPCHDQVGNDICHHSSSNINELLVSAHNDPNCVAVNTQGYMKSSVDKITQIGGWYLANGDGIYIKKPVADDKDYSSEIPVLGVLVCATTKWLKKQLDSIDYPIENYIIINNNTELLKDDIDSIVSIKHPFIKNLKVYHMPYNMGCADGWNTIIKSFMFAPYWIITNDDISFQPGFLQEMNEAAQDEEVGMVHGKPVNLTNLTHLGSFELFLIKDWVIQSHGLFDSNYYPAYYEDADYMMRLLNKPIKVINQLKHSFYHGDTIDYNKSGSNTLKENNQSYMRIKYARYQNSEYFMNKWNTLLECDCSPYKTPFNDPSLPLSYTSFDLKFARGKHLRNSLNLHSPSPIQPPKHIPSSITIDNFYDDPDEVREYALGLDYQPEENHGAVGFRCEAGKRILPGTRELFEKYLGRKIKNWDAQGTNGCFQWCPETTRIVYHCDQTKYAAIIFLTPDAPPEAGLSLCRHKKYKIMDNSIFGKPDWYSPNRGHKEPHTDKTPWERVDKIGNVYNRLVLFNAQYVHAVTEYFGDHIHNSRLFQLFFFDI